MSVLHLGKAVICFGLVAGLMSASGCGGSGASAPILSFVNSSNPATNKWPQSIAVADLNGDGKLDLVVPDGSGADATILLGNGDGTFTAGPVFPVSGQVVNNAVVADFNGDGRPDLAISLPDSNQIQILLGNGDGSFTPLAPIAAYSVFQVATADLNKDGKADLVVVNTGTGTISILLGVGNGTFPAPTTIVTPTISAGGVSLAPVSVGVGDFNRDGYLDLAVVNGPIEQGAAGSVTILLGKGDGSFAAVAQTPATGGSPLSVTVGDLNGDGRPDLVIPNMNHGATELGDLTILLGNGDGTFTPAATSPQVGAVPYSAVITDLDGDGKADLVVANSGSNTLTVLVGKGDGGFAVPIGLSTGTGPDAVAVGDFNGDGIPDLAAANNLGDTVTVLLTQRTPSGQ